MWEGPYVYSYSLSIYITQKNYQFQRVAQFQELGKKYTYLHLFTIT